jgi:ubiquinone/menaquinone biosynthesis C-methylase UbiE
LLIDGESEVHLPEVRSHFIFKGKTMHGRLKLPSSVARKRKLVHQQVQRQSKRSLSHIRAHRILDVGTGYGMSAKTLAKRFGNSSLIWSIDPSTEVLRQVRNDLKVMKYARRIKFRKARAEDLPFGAETFDLVVSLLALHHFSKPEKGVREMVRVLAPGGRLIVADWRPVKSPVVPHAPKHIPSPTHVTELVRPLGFSITIHKGRYWYLIDAMKKW